jgi:hypothetical protein
MKEEMISIPKREYDKMIEKINFLERRLLAYENAHTPPSKQQFKKKD